MSLEPGAKLAPPSLDTTTVPRAPTPTTRVALAYAAPRIIALDGVTTDAVAPPSAVRTRWSPAATVITHVFVLAQSMELKELPCAIDWVAHVAPPSALLSSVLGPIANACSASTKCSAVTFAEGTTT